jgi:5'-phosphate synthase pdxT subunit
MKSDSERRRTEMTIGVLALQGDFAEHLAALRQLGVDCREVRLPEELDPLDGLILPGGESTTFALLMESYGFVEPLRAFALDPRPIWGSCAGLIALAREVVGMSSPIIGLLDITARRNAYGRQVESFETALDIPALGAPPVPAVFIRAPVIESTGPDVEVLASLPNGAPVAVRQGTLLATAFHPELTTDRRFHEYFLDMVLASRSSNVAAV